MPHNNNYTPEQAQNAIVSQETLKLRSAILMFCEAVQAVTITNPEQYQSAGEISKVLATYRKQLDEARSTEIAPYLEKQRAINDWCKPVLVAINDLQGKVGAAIRVYQAEQEKKRREAQRAAEEKARKEAEEKRRQAEEARQAAEAAREQGNADIAEDLDAQAMELDFEQTAPAPVAAPEANKLEGVHVRHNWTAEITDDNAFVQHCVDNKLYDLLAGDVKKLRAKAKMVKRPMSFPGARIFDKPTTVARSN